MIAENATLADLVDTLDDPEDFIRNAMGAMYSAAVGGKVTLRIGIRGTGRRPNYRLDDIVTADAIQAIDGNNHQPFPAEFDINSPDNWSSKKMTLAEIKELLGEVISSKK